jgi:hypothetical protein
VGSSVGGGGASVGDGVAEPSQYVQNDPALDSEAVLPSQAPSV